MAKVQFNSSTLKVSYIAANNTVQTVAYGEDCACFASGATPKFYTVTFSGINDCPDEDVSWANDTFQLEQHGSFPCRYVWSEGSGGTQKEIVLDLDTALSRTEITIIYGAGWGVFWWYDSSNCQTSGENKASRHAEGDCGEEGGLIGFGGSVNYSPMI